MSRKQMKTWQKATALVPLALLSGAWTASLAVTSTATAATEHASTLPDGTTLPSHPLKAPASVSVPGEIAPGVPAGAADSVIASSSADGIPAAALGAYQRAAQVIDTADASCDLQWPLIAAIGRVESDHGRYGGSTLGSDGVSRPGIYGIPLDGSHGTTLIRDTDGGRYDHDPVYDRAVGPMQFIPSTWAVVGVDGDGDGTRNPQDIDDAALATAVYLCSGTENLSTPSGQQAAVYRYNHSQAYVDLVLSIMRSYSEGDYSAVPNGTAATTTFTPFDAGSVFGSRSAGHHAHKPSSGRAPSTKGSGSGSGGGGTTSAGGGSTPSGSGPSSAPSVPGSSTAPNPTDTVTKTVKKVTDGATKATQPVVDTLSAGAESLAFCTTQVPDLATLSTSAQQTVLDGCAAKVAGMTKAAAADAIPNTLPGVLSWLGLSLTDPIGGLLGN
jgi:hypothetical protein